MGGGENLATSRKKEKTNSVPDDSSTRFGLPDPRSYDLGSLNQDLLYKSPLKREKEN